MDSSEDICGEVKIVNGEEFHCIIPVCDYHFGEDHIYAVRNRNDW